MWSLHSRVRLGSGGSPVNLVFRLAIDCMLYALAPFLLFVLARPPRFLADMLRFKAPLCLALGCTHLPCLLVLWTAQVSDPHLWARHHDADITP